MSEQQKQTVKMVRFHQTGGPEVLKLEDEALPEPGKGEVRLRVKAIGLNRAEVSFREGKYLIQPKLPSGIGYEASGIVEAVGEGVDPALVGQVRSVVPSFQMNEYGVYGEVAIVPDYALAAYPEKLSFEQGTGIWMQYITAWGALVHFGKVKAGDFVLITAASSSVGLAAIEIAKAEGATPIATTRTSAKKAELERLGAPYVIVTEEEDLAARVMEITGGKGAQLIFDPVAGPGVKALMNAAGPSATLFLYGALSAEPTPYPLFPAITKHLTVKAYTLFEVMADPALRQAGEKYVYDHLQSGEFKPQLDQKKFRLDEIVEAHRYMEANQQIGKIVVTVGT